MLHFIFSIFGVAFLVAFVSLLLFKSILHLLHFCVEFSEDVFFLLIFQLIRFRNDWVNNLINLVICMFNYILLHMPLPTHIHHILLHIIIKHNLLRNHSYLQILLELIYFSSVFLFAANKPLLSTFYIVFYFVIFILNFLRFFNNLSKAFIPITWSHILVRILIFQINFFHYK